jgi:hypothetical protein
MKGDRERRQEQQAIAEASLGVIRSLTGQVEGMLLAELQRDDRWQNKTRFGRPYY